MRTNRWADRIRHLLANENDIASCSKIVGTGPIASLQLSRARLDPAPLRVLRGLERNLQPSLVAELVELFRNETPAQLHQLCRQIENGEREQVARTAHALKSSAANLGAVRVRQISEYIESHVDHPLSELRLLAAALESEFIFAVNELEEYLVT